MNGRRSQVYEILAMSFLIAICVAVSVGCFFRCRTAAQDAHALDLGLGYTQDIADQLAASEGDLEAVWGPDTTRLYFNGRFEPCDPKLAVYWIVVGPVESDGYLESAIVQLDKFDGTILFQITSSWQASGVEAGGAAYGG